MFDPLQILIQDDPYRAYSIISATFLILILVGWVSIIDIIKKRIVFWKMIIASSSVILGPFIVSIFFGPSDLKWYILASFALWIGLLFLNVVFNKDKFIGKADIDLLSALFSVALMVSIWLIVSSESGIGSIKVTFIWYNLFLWLLVGSLIFIGIFSIYFISMILLKKRTFKDLLKNTKISVLPMVLPASVMFSLTIMTL